MKASMLLGTMIRVESQFRKEMEARGDMMTIGIRWLIGENECTIECPPLVGKGKYIAQRVVRQLASGAILAPERSEFYDTSTMELVDEDNLEIPSL